MSAEVLLDVRVVRPGQVDGEAREGVEAPVVEWGMQGVEDDVHGADERRHESARDLRSRLTFAGGAAESIR
jgi:hypothetical protein